MVPSFARKSELILAYIFDLAIGVINARKINGARARLPFFGIWALLPHLVSASFNSFFTSSISSSRAFW